MNHLIPGDLVRIIPLTDKPKYHPLGDQLGVVIEQQDGTHRFQVMLVGEGENNRMFWYSSAILRKVEQ